MHCYSFEEWCPIVSPKAFVHPTAVLIGDVFVDDGCYIGPFACQRPSRVECSPQLICIFKDNLNVRPRYQPALDALLTGGMMINLTNQASKPSLIGVDGSSKTPLHG